jgi:hypothetical protein
VIDPDDSILTILTLIIKVEANRIEIASIGTAYLHVSGWHQQFRQTAFRC